MLLVLQVLYVQAIADKLIAEIRKNKKSVGIIAIDPSSSRSGGALLGDRTRFY